MLRQIGQPSILKTFVNPAYYYVQLEQKPLTLTVVIRLWYDSNKFVRYGGIQ
jgi:hypothetical protein